MISKPLFIIVAQSMVIFAPIFHVGCFKASSLFILSKSSIGTFLNAPPEAVIINLETSFGSHLDRHLAKATCSLSIG